ncbi:hypothetical protein, partial [Staphylococcus capitis]|uniref:hypothetical protein n=7 Tax=Staphylococcus TaxID=1279 RepID=UPI001E57210F
DNILVKLFISEIVHTEDSFLLKLYYKFNFATEPYISCAILMVIAFGSLFRELGNRNENKRLDILSSILVLISAIALLIYGIFIN